MAQRNFFTAQAGDTIPAALSGLSGEDLTLLGYGVNRYAAAGAATLAVDNSATLAADATNITVANELVTIDGAGRVPNTGTHYFIVNKSVRIATASSLRCPTANGTHVSLINCTILIEGQVSTNHEFRIGCSTSAGNNDRSRDVSIAGGENNTASMNLYGCAVLNSAGTSTNFSTNLQPADCIDTDLWSVANPHLLGRTNGGRLQNVTMSKKSLPPGPVLTGYGLYDLFSNVNIDNYIWAVNSDTNQEIALVDRPNFSNPNQETFYEFNTVTGIDNDGRQSLPIQIIAGPVLESANNVWGPANGATGVTPMIQLGGGGTGATATGGGLMQYWGYGNSYFSDIALTNPVPGVKLRVTSTVNATLLTAAAKDWGDGGFGQQLGGTVVCDYVTDVTGRFASDSYSINGVAAVDGYVDWMAWRTRPVTGARVLGTNTSDISSPAGLVLAPIEQSWPTNYTNASGGKAYQRYPINFSVRSYPFDVAIAQQTVPVYGADDTQVTEEEQMVVASLVGTVIKSQNVNAVNNSPNIAFPAGSTVSINDVRDAYRAGWWNYDYEVIGDNPLTRILSLEVSNTHGSDYSFASGVLTVRGNGIALDGTNDLFTSDTNLTTLNLNGGTLDDHQLTVSGAVTGLGNTNDSILRGGSIALTGTVTGSTLSAPTITGATLATFTGGGNTYGVDNATVAITFTGTGGTQTLDGLLGTGWDIGDSVNLSLASNQATIINVDAQDVATLGLVASDGTTLTQGKSSATANNITYRFPDSSVVFTHEAFGNGGSFAVFSRATPTAAWAQVQSTQRPGAGVQATIQVENPNVEYIALWKPMSALHFCNTAYYDFTGGISADTEREIITLAISPELISSAASTVPAGVSISWNPGSGSTAGQLVGSLTGSDTGEDRVSDAATQTLLRTAYFDTDYFDTIVNSVNGTVNPVLLPSPLASGGRADFIIPDSPVSTRANGDFLELEAGTVSSAVAQQGITALTNSGTDSLTAQISGTNAGVTISFAAVDIATSPDGISVAEVTAAVNTELVPVKANHQVLLTATQRGAVKAATYSAGELNT